MFRQENVQLRPVWKTDLKNFLKWYNDPEVTCYLRMFFPIMEASEEKWINDLATIKHETDAVFVIEVKIKKRWVPIGSCGIHDINWHDRDAELGMAIGEKKFQSNGYGTIATRLLINYAFSQLNLHRVSSAAYAFNVRSLKMQERAGLRIEGCVRKSIYRNGEYHDKIIRGMLREEWEKMRK